MTTTAITTRRAWLALAGAGSLAAGLAWQQRRAATPSRIPEDFWELTLPDPAGAQVPLARFKGHALLLNFWASWCPPCVRELPALDQWATQLAPSGTQVIGLAVEAASAVAPFLRQHPVSFPVLIADTRGLAWSRALGNTAGGLPFSVLLSDQSQVLQQKLGPLDATDLSTWQQLVAPSLAS